MQIDFFKNLKNSKWLPWVGVSLFILMPLVVMFHGEMWQWLGISAFFGSMWVGISSGGYIARFITSHFLATSEETRKRLSIAFSAFGFLFLPAVVGSWANTYLNTNIDMHSLGAHFLWACVVGTLLFSFKLTDV